MDVTVRAATKEDVPALVALHTSQNEFGGRWVENPLAGGEGAENEDLTPPQRGVPGGPRVGPPLPPLPLHPVYDAHRGIPAAGPGGGGRGAAGALARGG